jgi:NAD(P)H-dependent FMN reductase
MKLLAFAASHRKESINRKLARNAADSAESLGASVAFAEYSDFDCPIYDDEVFNEAAFPEPVVRFINHLSDSAGIILSAPEYNWSFPGSLKNLIDWASVRKPSPFAGKTVLLLSASPSLRGGAQGLVQLQVPLSALGAFVYPKFFTLARAEPILAGGKVADEKLSTELNQLVSSFVRFTEANS